ncbi:MAG: metalloregulator ArsR/SmtB family transcription factor [Gammaproteobacteria bacterium]|nr:metalloregulator ArsR/SmtB family transcription factor [Gammaproteobacteria bacterium]MDH5654035.1 metalloregulator ArsR/SmtB family transcription factor [Gammaproteobacteria bacterium]
MAIQYSSTLDRTFRALGDESRRKMLATISQRGQCSANELVEMFNSSQPTISKHLRVMEQAGLVVRKVEGRQHFFTMNTAPLEEADKWLQRHLSFWESSLSRLGEFLDKSKDRE